jgi:hypothetical protein
MLQIRKGSSLKTQKKQKKKTTKRKNPKKKYKHRWAIPQFCRWAAWA